MWLQLCPPTGCLTVLSFDICSWDHSCVLLLAVEVYLTLICFHVVTVISFLLAAAFSFFKRYFHVVLAYKYMVRNHQDGYPYLNLSQCFYFWKFPEILIFLAKLILQWIPINEGRGSTRDIFKKNFNFQHSTKNGS